MLILEVWLFVNILGLFALIAIAHSKGMWAPMIYPVLDEYLTEQCYLGGRSKNFLKFAFTLIFLPAFIAYFTVMVLYLAVMVAIYAFVEK
jgi:hypothetical protein